MELRCPRLRALPEVRADALLHAAAARERQALQEAGRLEQKAARLAREAARLAPLEDGVARLESDLEYAVQPNGACCPSCGYYWFVKPNRKKANFCLNSGKQEK